MLCLLCPLLFSYTLAAFITQNGIRAPSPQDMICNNGTEFQCYCLRESARVGEVPDCETFIENGFLSFGVSSKTHELPVVDMRLRHVNLEADLHTKEKYESYFKRRIANIVSAYCEHQANECPGTTLRLKKVDLNDEDSVLYGTDETDPLLTQENVILLRVEKEARNVTRIQFAISKNEGIGALNEHAVIDPVKVKYILGSQAGPLSRILGGIRIDSVRVSRIRRTLNKVPENNSKLIIIGLVVAAFFIICYIIGIIRLCRDCKKRKKERVTTKTEEDAIISTVNNYGTCAEGDKRECTIGGERKQSETVKRNGGGGLYGEGTYQQIDENVLNSPRIDDRHARIMFLCDPSQLPKEISFDEGMDIRESPPRRSRTVSDKNSVTPRNSPVMEREEIREKEEEEESVEREKTPEKEETEISKETQTPPPSPTIDQFSSQAPPVLLFQPSLSLGDSSMDSSGQHSTESADIQESVDNQGLLFSPLNIDRPASRRGSRVDEIDIDEILDMRERRASKDIPVPLVVENEKERDLINNRLNDIDHWSSSDEEVDVYYKMSEDEVEGDDWTTLTNVHQNKTLPNREIEEDEEESDIEKEEERMGEDEGYVYERLREDPSPLPPPTVITDDYDEDSLR